MINITKTHVFFFKDWLSNFHPSEFEMITCNGKYQTFRTSEQAFMYQKALYFHDQEVAQKILNSLTPMEAKQLGRKVRNYDDNIWASVRFDFMYSCNYHKYDQNQELKKQFLDPRFDNHIFVEASPFDHIWGIALDQKNHDLNYLDNESNWKGNNLLGKVLTEVYKSLKETEKING